MQRLLFSLGHILGALATVLVLTRPRSHVRGDLKVGVECVLGGEFADRVASGSDYDGDFDETHCEG